VNSLPCGWLLPDLKVPPHPPLAVDTTRYVGDPVAIVIAESQEVALDAAEKVKVDWEIRPAVTATAKAADRGAAQIHEVAPSNVAFKWQIGDAAAVDAAVKSAAVVVKKRSSTSASWPTPWSRARAWPASRRPPVTSTLW